MYKPNDVKLTNAPEEMVQYVINNVEDFEPRYKHALGIMDKQRCPIIVADSDLHDDIYNAMCDWTLNELETYPEDLNYDIEEIFG